MKFSKWTSRSVLLTALLVYSHQPLMAGERWWPFGRHKQKVTPACDEAGCATITSAPRISAAPAPASVEPASIPPEQQYGTAAVQQQSAPAMFAAPAAGGTIIGEQNGVRVRGFGVTMPELHLELPTFHLPSIIRSRRNPEMELDGGRAPMVSGTPAAYGHLANAGPVTGYQHVSSVPSNPPAAASIAPRPRPASVEPPAAPASIPPADSCVPQIPGCVPTIGAYNGPVDEVAEMRQTLVAYRQELLRMQRMLDATTANRNEPGANSEIPPSPEDEPIKRLSYTQQRKESVPLRKRPPQKIVEAEELEELEQEELPLIRRRISRTSSGAATVKPSRAARN